MGPALRLRCAGAADCGRTAIPPPLLLFWRSGSRTSSSPNRAERAPRAETGVDAGGAGGVVGVRADCGRAVDGDAPRDEAESC
mmetsp:Transcript_12051/g.39650  ORF Transcript_12051/g.39650 Transcript_12051/m.39650 type:complete len:83 (+) Transcript_12051:603-851(+)